MYTVIDNEQIVYVDVDETLVMERIPPWCDPGEELHIRNPYDGKSKIRYPHTKHIELIQMMHGRGRHIIVHSGNGVKWAQAVVDTLALGSYVHAIATKPIAYIDDHPAQNWMGQRIYLGETS